MGDLATAATTAGKPSKEVAKAAVQDALADGNDADELARQLYKEATGRFPQDSGDRLSVYIGAMVLVGIVFLIAAILTTVLLLNDKTVPDAMTTIAAALISGVIGGLFGYAQQGK